MTEATHSYPVSASEALAKRLDDADFVLIRNCPMVTKFDHENVDTMLTGEEHNLIVTALRTGGAAQSAMEGELDTVVQLIHKHVDVSDLFDGAQELIGVEDAAKAILSALSSTDPRCTCAAIVNPNIPHARSCPLSSTSRESDPNIAPCDDAEFGTKP